MRLRSQSYITSNINQKHYNHEKQYNKSSTPNTKIECKTHSHTQAHTNTYIHTYTNIHTHTHTQSETQAKQKNFRTTVVRTAALWLSHFRHHPACETFPAHDKTPSDPRTPDVSPSNSQNLSTQVSVSVPLLLLVFCPSVWLLQLLLLLRLFVLVLAPVCVLRRLLLFVLVRQPISTKTTSRGVCVGVCAYVMCMVLCA